MQVLEGRFRKVSNIHVGEQQSAYLNTYQRMWEGGKQSEQAM